MGLSLERLLLALAIGAMAVGALLANPESARADHYACHTPNRGWGFDTYEYEEYVGKYGQAIDIAVRGWAVPPPYTVGDESINVSYQGLESGPRGARIAATPTEGIPPTVYKAIAHIEADWANAASQVPYGGTGSTLTSIDCGYGIGQITSGMGHLGAPPALDVRVPAARQAIIGTHPLFNIAEGVRILADKWNSAPNFRPIAGLGDPAVLEDWYYAIWSYNGFAFSNHPLNPTKDPLRGSVWHCGDPNAPGFAFFDRGDYTYTEDVYGCMRYPPMPHGVDYPPPLNPNAPPTPPNPGGAKFLVGDEIVVFGTGNGLNVRSSPGTAAPILAVVPDGTHMTVVGGPQAASGFTWWSVQFGGLVGWAAEQFLAKPQAEPPPDAPVNPAGRMWLPQEFSMPNLASPEIAAALTAAAYLACDSADFAGGCASMDFPTTPHYDTSPPGNPSDAAYFLGDPKLEISGSRTINLTANATSATFSAVTLRNLGTALAPYRVRTSDDWLVVHHPGNPRIIDGGVAIGSNYEVVDQKIPRVATAGRDSLLQITVDPRFLAAGTHTGTVTIDALLGTATKAVFTVTVVSTGGGGGGPGAPTPTPAPTQAPPVFRAILPNLSAEGSH